MSAANHPAEESKIVVEILDENLQRLEIDETTKDEAWLNFFEAYRNLSKENQRIIQGLAGSMLFHDESKPTRTVMVSVRSTGRANP
jgi:alpha-ketoglutarate-dependent taurine dioxygenase